MSVYELQVLPNYFEQAGVYLYAGAGGVLERNDIFMNVSAGVAISEGASPSLVENLIRDGQDAGVLVHDDGRGELRSNNIHSNRTYGIACLTGGAPRAARNWVHGIKQGGVLCDEGGAGEFEQNEIAENAKSGITLRGACQPVSYFVACSV